MSRPRGSQLGAWVSDQSSVLSSRDILEIKLKEMKRKFSDGKIPLPDFWEDTELYQKLSNSGRETQSTA